MLVIHKGRSVVGRIALFFADPGIPDGPVRRVGQETETVLALTASLSFLVVAVVIFAVSMFLMTRLGTEFLPELDEGFILIEQVWMPSVTLDESIENANWLAGKLMENIPEIQTVVPKTGRSDLINDWMGVHQTDVWVVLKPPKEWRKGLTKEAIAAEIEPYLKTEPGLVYNFTQPIAMRVDELTSGASGLWCATPKVFEMNCTKYRMCRCICPTANLFR